MRFHVEAAFVTSVPGSFPLSPVPLRAHGQAFVHPQAALVLSALDCHTGSCPPWSPLGPCLIDFHLHVPLGFLFLVCALRSNRLAELTLYLVLLRALIMDVSCLLQ